MELPEVDFRCLEDIFEEATLPIEEDGLLTKDQMEAEIAQWQKEKEDEKNRVRIYRAGFMAGHMAIVRNGLNTLRSSMLDYLTHNRGVLCSLLETHYKTWCKFNVRCSLVMNEIFNGEYGHYNIMYLYSF